MNTLVVYYSRTGHNEELAQQLHKEMGGDLDQIVDTKDRTNMLGCVMAAIFKAKTRIQFTKDPSDYEQVVVVSPLWVGSLPPATRTYLAQNQAKINQFAFISVCGNGEENRNALADVSTAAKRSPVASLLLREQAFESGSTQASYAEFVKQLPH